MAGSVRTAAARVRPLGSLWMLRKISNCLISIGGRAQVIITSLPLRATCSWAASTLPAGAEGAYVVWAATGKAKAQRSAKRRRGIIGVGVAGKRRIQNPATTPDGFYSKNR